MLVSLFTTRSCQCNSQWIEKRAKDVWKHKDPTHILMLGTLMNENTNLTDFHFHTLSYFLLCSLKFELNLSHISFAASL